MQLICNRGEKRLNKKNNIYKYDLNGKFRSYSDRLTVVLVVNKPLKLLLIYLINSCLGSHHLEEEQKEEKNMLLLLLICSLLIS